MTRIALVSALLLSVSISSAGARAEAPEQLRAVLVKPKALTPTALAEWDAQGMTAVVVVLDEASRPTWAATAEAVSKANLDLYAWVEVGRNPTMADAHPDWMASPGGHHDDWRRLFPEAPTAARGEVIKSWPWVPIGYAPAFEAHRARLSSLLKDLPGRWAGVFLNDLQAAPSSCGCGNDRCRWALDYGSPATAPRRPGDDAASRLVAEVRGRHPGKSVIPVWVTECEPIDLPRAEGGTGHCGDVPCAKGDCWPRYARQWDPLVESTSGPLAVAAWPEAFRLDSSTWIASTLRLFRRPPGAKPIAAERTVAVLQAWGLDDAKRRARVEAAAEAKGGWVLALEPIEQGWEPRVVKVP